MAPKTFVQVTARYTILTNETQHTGREKKGFTIYQVYFKTDLENMLVKSENLNSSKTKKQKNNMYSQCIEKYNSKIKSFYLLVKPPSVHNLKKNIQVRTISKKERGRMG